MPSLSKEHSLRLKFLNFPLIVGVVYIHAYAAEITLGSTLFGPSELGAVTDFVRKLVSQGVARLAVPLFFLMSGFFFFCDFSRQTLAGKLRTRCRTLLFPYLFWTIGFVAVRLVGQHLPGIEPYFGSVILSELGPVDLLDATLGITRAPEAYHFWFIRDLMLLMLLSPVLDAILGNLARPFLVALFVAWVVGWWPLYTPDVVGVLFFSLGGWCARQGSSLFAFDRYGKLLTFCYIPLLIADVVWYEAWFNVTLHRCTIVIGLGAALYQSRFLLAWPRLGEVLLRLGGASFFVYAAHEPLLGMVRTLAFQWLPIDRPGMLLAVYLLAPLLVVTVLVVLHRALTQLAPKAVQAITGGR